MDRPLTSPQQSATINEGAPGKQVDDPGGKEANENASGTSDTPQTEAPANAIGPDGRVHLQGGGSLSKEQWDDAERRLRNSPEFK